MTALRTVAGDRTLWQSAAGGGSVQAFGRYILVRGPESTGVTVLDAASGAGRWSRPAGRAYVAPAAPDTVYLVDGAELQELDLASGAVRGATTLAGPSPYPRGLIADGAPVLLLGSAGDDGQITAYAAHGLQELWTTAGLGDVGDAGDPRTLLTWDGDGNVRRVDPHTGQPRWSHAGRADTLNHDSRVVVSGNLVLVCSKLSGSTLRIDALDTISGAVRWSSSYPTINNGGIAVARDVTYAYVSMDYTAVAFTLHAVDNSNGAELWSVPFRQDGFASAQVAVEGGILLSADRGLSLLGS